jgi:hypothetical protein
MFLFTGIKAPVCGDPLKSISNTEIHVDLTKCHSQGIIKFQVVLDNFQKFKLGNQTDIPIPNLIPGTQYTLQIASVVVDAKTLDIQTSPELWMKNFSTSKLNFIGISLFYYVSTTIEPTFCKKFPVCCSFYSPV